MRAATRALPARRGRDLRLPVGARLRSWLALDRFRAGMSERAGRGGSMPQRVADIRPTARSDRWKSHSATLSPPVVSRARGRSLTWLVPFIAKAAVAGPRRARRAVGGGPRPPRPHHLIYVTPMAQARRRGARALAAIRRHAEEVSVSTRSKIGLAGGIPPALAGRARLRRPCQSLDDEALRADQSVAEWLRLSRLWRPGRQNSRSPLPTGILRWRSIRALNRRTSLKLPRLHK